MPEPWLELKGISKSYVAGIPVLENVSFSAHAGQIISLLGRSGCGKSTLLNIVSGIEPPTDGELQLSGLIAYAPQRDLLLPWRNVVENVLLPFELLGPVSKDQVVKARRLLASVGLGGEERKWPHELSGGMRQRVSLARALIQEGDLLLCDEPLSAVDFDLRLKLVRQLRESVIQSRKAALYVTHNVEEAIAIADRVLVIGEKPARIVLSAEIQIDESQRDPVLVRRSAVFQKLFGDLWQALSNSGETH